MRNHKKDYYFRGCFGVHVIKFSYVYGIFGSLFEFLSLLYIIIGSIFTTTAPWYHIILNLLSLISYLTLMTGIKREQVSLLWVYFIINTLCVLLDMILIIALLAYHSELIHHHHPGLGKKQEQEIAVLTLIYAVFVTLSAILNIYCIGIVWRAKIYLQQMRVPTSIYHLTGAKPYRPSRWGKFRHKQVTTLPDV